MIFHFHAIIVCTAFFNNYVCKEFYVYMFMCKWLKEAHSPLDSAIN